MSNCRQSSWWARWCASHLHSIPRTPAFQTSKWLGQVAASHPSASIARFGRDSRTGRSTRQRTHSALLIASRCSRPNAPCSRRGLRWGPSSQSTAHRLGKPNLLCQCRICTWKPRQQDPNCKLLLSDLIARRFLEERGKKLFAWASGPNNHTSKTRGHFSFIK